MSHNETKNYNKNNKLAHGREIQTEKENKSKRKYINMIQENPIQQQPNKKSRQIISKKKMNFSNAGKYYRHTYPYAITQ